MLGSAYQAIFLALVFFGVSSIVALLVRVAARDGYEKGEQSS